MREITRAQLLKGGAGAAAGLLILGVAGCSSSSKDAKGPLGTPKRGGIAKLSMSGASANESLDPAVANQPNAILLCASVYDMLLQTDNAWKLSPMLATSWTTTDNKKWVIKLREGVKFHDGSPFTADDVIYSLTRLLDKKLGSSLHSRMAPLVKPENLKATDPHTLEITLETADSTLPYLLAQHAAAIMKKGTTTFDGTVSAGTGAFKVKAFTAGRSWELARNEAYWESGYPLLDGVKASVVGEQSTKVQTVVSGDADLADAVDFSVASTLKSNANVQLLNLENATIINIVMDATQKPFDNPKVIEAVKLATDRSKIVKLAYQSFASEAADTPAPADDTFFPSSLKVPGQDIAKAKELLAEAGFPGGIDLELFTTQATGGMVDVAVTFAKLVEPAGIRVKITQKPVDNYFSDVWLQKPMYSSYWGRRFPGEALAVAYESTAPWNESRVKSTAIDGALAKMRASTDPAEQKAALGAGLEAAAKESGAVIPAFADSIMLAKKRLQGVELSYDRVCLLHKAYLNG